MAEDPALIQAEGLSKYYGGFTAIEDVSFEVNAGEVVAFLGPNGAGKSTTMKILTGFLTPSKGVARIAGHDVANERTRAAEVLGYLPENGPLYGDMTPESFLEFMAAARGLSKGHARERIAAVVSRCALGDVVRKPIRKLSKGYRQRVGMANVLLHEPKVLVMDEPTSGLDPNQILTVRETIREIGKECAVLYSTHILQEVEAVADRIVMINEGRVVFRGTPSELAKAGEGTLEAAFHKLTGAA